MVSPAFAHGVGSGNTGEGYAPLILLLGIIVFILFLVFIHRKKGWSVLVIGGAGYVGSALVPRLLKQGHHVTVLDLYHFGEDSLKDVRNHVNLLEIRGDIRDPETVKGALHGCDAAIHLVGVADEVSVDHSTLVNIDTFISLVRIAKEAGINRFIYASSTSVYGAFGVSQVTEETSLLPISEFSKHTVQCETILNEERGPGFVTTIVRPGNICGFAPRHRLDIVANALTYAAITEGRIQVSDSAHNYPNIHIKDMVGLYIFLLGQPNGRIDGKIYNAVAENHSLLELAETIRNVVSPEVLIEDIPPKGSATYTVSSDKLRNELGFVPRHTLREAIFDLVAAFQAGDLQSPYNNQPTSNISK